MRENRNRQRTKESKTVPHRALWRPSVSFLPAVSSRRDISTKSAFTLIELLVVLAIIGILSEIGLVAIRGFGKSNAVTAATRQLLDDVTLARQRAISGHTDVYMVFISSGIVNYPFATL